MATLIAVYDSEGCVGPVRRQVLTAHEPGCASICGGANHGAGFDQAVDNTHQHAEKWLGRATHEGGNVNHAELGAVTAPTLF